MNRTEHLLTIAAEECAEIAQRATKALRFGLDEVQRGQELTNAERILLEYHDLVAVINMLQNENALPRGLNTHDILAKQSKVEHYLQFSAQCGTLDKSPA